MPAKGFFFSESGLSPSFYHPHTAIFSVPDGFLASNWTWTFMTQKTHYDENYFIKYWDIVRNKSCNTKYLSTRNFFNVSGNLYIKDLSLFDSMTKSLIDHYRCIRCKYWSSTAMTFVQCIIEGSIKGLCVNRGRLREGWRHLSVIISITLSPYIIPTSWFVFAPYGRNPLLQFYHHEPFSCEWIICLIHSR